MRGQGPLPLSTPTLASHIYSAVPHRPNRTVAGRNDAAISGRLDGGRRLVGCQPGIRGRPYPIDARSQRLPRHCGVGLAADGIDCRNRSTTCARGYLPEALRAKLRQARDGLRTALAYTHDVRTSELWSWTFADGHYRLAPLARKAPTKIWSSQRSPAMEYRYPCNVTFLLAGASKSRWLMIFSKRSDKSSSYKRSTKGKAL